MTDTVDRRAFVAAMMAPVLAPSSLFSLLDAWPARHAAPPIHAPSPDFMAGLPRMMEIAGVPGIAAVLVQDGRVAWQHLAGVMDAGTGQPVTADTLWPAASLSKPVFTLAALRLVDGGALDLDRPLKQYVPDHAPNDERGDRISARHVLSHSSGLRNWRQRADQPLVPDFEPGARFQYSGEGFYYLQRVVEHIAGMGFERFMQERLFAPLRMTSSTYAWRADVNARLVTGHDQGSPRPNLAKDFGPRLVAYAAQQNVPLANFRHEETVQAMQRITPAPAAIPNSMIPNAAATLLTTPADYGAFLIALLSGGNAAVDLKPATRATMMRRHTTINSALGWGLGWALETSRGAQEPSFLWHWGDNGSWKNFVLAHPASHSAIVVFTNGSRGLNIARELLSSATGELRPAFLWL